MSDGKRQKLSLSDIIKKLNEEKPDPAAPATADDSPLNPNPDAVGDIVPQSLIERPLPAESTRGEPSVSPLPNTSQSAQSAQGHQTTCKKTRALSVRPHHIPTAFRASPPFPKKTTSMQSLTFRFIQTIRRETTKPAIST